MRVMQSVTDVGKYRDFPSSCNRAGGKMRSGNETTRTQGFSENMAAEPGQPVFVAGIRP